MLYCTCSNAWYKLFRIFLMFCFWFVNRVDWFTHIGAYGSNKSQINHGFCCGSFLFSFAYPGWSLFVNICFDSYQCFTQQFDKSPCERGIAKTSSNFPWSQRWLMVTPLCDRSKTSISLILFVSFFSFRSPLPPSSCLPYFYN